jgi:hypothetical protein
LNTAGLASNAAPISPPIKVDAQRGAAIGRANRFARQAMACGQIAECPVRVKQAANPPFPHRGLLPWRFSYAGPGAHGTVRERPASENLHKTRNPQNEDMFSGLHPIADVTGSRHVTPWTRGLRLPAQPTSQMSD